MQKNPLSSSNLESLIKQKSISEAFQDKISEEKLKNFSSLNLKTEDEKS